ncbi:hypothetical protein CHS0354_013358, partial [Potamilus streckersoni]
MAVKPTVHKQASTWCPRSHLYEKLDSDSILILLVYEVLNGLFTSKQVQKILLGM